MDKRFFTRPDLFHHSDVAEGQVSPSERIVCPICGFDYNHLQTPARLVGWESTDNGARSNYQWSGRGDGIALPIEGECGHRWVICVAFHKGQLFMFAVASGDRAPTGGSGLPAWVQRLHLADGNETSTSPEEF